MIGDRIKKERNLKNITQNELSKLLDVSPSTIGMYEQNRRLPDITKIIKLANIFDVSSDYLLNLTDIRNAVDEITDILQINKQILDLTMDLQNRRDLQELIKITKVLEPKSVEKIITVVETINFDETL